MRQARVDNLLKLLGKVYPAFAASVQPKDFSAWAGFRPMSADGVPTVSATKFENLFLNTGHGHIGWTTCAGSARLLADLMLKRVPAVADIPIVRDGDNWVMRLNYEETVPLFGQLWLLLKFDKTTVLR